MELVLLALGLAAGAPPWRIALLAVAIWFPWGVAVLVLVVFTVHRRAGGDRAARFLEGVAAELRAGSSLRQALAASARAVGEEGLAAACMEGGYGEVGAVAAAAFPGIGREIEVTIAGAARSGGAAADLFDELASVALAHEEIRREVVVASAPGRVAAGIFVGAPALYLGQRWAAGDLAVLFASGPRRIAGIAGMSLFLAGLAGVLVVMWRAR